MAAVVTFKQPVFHHPFQLREVTDHLLPKMRFVWIENNYMYWVGFETWNDEFF